MTSRSFTGGVKTVGARCVAPYSIFFGSCAFTASGHTAAFDACSAFGKDGWVFDRIGGNGSRQQD